MLGMGFSILQAHFPFSYQVYSVCFKTFEARCVSEISYFFLFKILAV